MEANPVADLSGLAAGETHLWFIPLIADVDAVQQHRQLLAPDERARAGRFHLAEHRRRFVVGHGAVRRILSRYVTAQPQEVVFVYGAKGKPDLAADQNPHRVKFNLTHSGDLALLAVTQNQELGVDVEFVKADFGGSEIAERFFSAREVAMLFAIDERERNAAFFACWTRKEAFIKAVGEGLSLPLDSFDVAFGPGVKPALTHVEGSPGEATRWSMYDIAAGPEYKAALVIAGDGHHLVHCHWGTEATGREASRRLSAP
jgi:4'-phosphopantetheinyl transferase